MQVNFTPAAMAFLGEKGVSAVTVASLVFSSCCSAPLPPEAKPGAPADPDGFHTFAAGAVTVYYDSLLDAADGLTIDCKDYGSYKELFIAGWE